MFRQLGWMIKKDVKELIRQMRAMGVVILAPIALIILFGLVLTQPGQKAEVMAPVELALCSYDTEIHPFMKERIMEHPYFKFRDLSYLGASCSEAAKAYVERGTYRGALIIPSGFLGAIKKGESKTLQFYLDESVVGLGGVVKGVLGYHLFEFSRELGKEFIFGTWKKIEEMNTFLKKIKRQLYSSEANLRKGKAFLKNQQSGLEEMERLLESYEEDLDESDRDLAGLAREIRIEREKVSQVYKNITCIEYPEEEVCLYIKKVINRMDSTLRKISHARKRIAYAKRGMQQAKANITQSKGSIQQYDQQLAEQEKSFQAIYPQIAAIEKELNYISRKNPENVVRPFDLEVISIFGTQNLFSLLLPIILSTILMLSALPLISITLVRERRSGTLARNAATPTPFGFFMLGKVSTLTLLILVQVAIFMLVGYLLFDVRISMNLLPSFLLGVIAATLTFLFLGMQIAIFSDTEATALLLSSSLAIAFIFLSGTVIPAEFLPPLVKNISYGIPLTHAVATLKAVYIYNAPIPLDSLVYMIGVIVTSFVFSFLVLRRQVFY